MWWLTNFGQQLSLVSCSQPFASGGGWFFPNKFFISGTLSVGILISILKFFFWSLCSNRYSSRSSFRLAILLANCFSRPVANEIQLNTTLCWFGYFGFSVVCLETKLMQCQKRIVCLCSFFFFLLVVLCMSNAPYDQIATHLNESVQWCHLLDFIWIWIEMGKLRCKRFNKN